MTRSKSEFTFQAAVERPLSAVFRGPGGTWEGHDYQVQVIAERKSLDAFDVVMDFRDLEAALDDQLRPWQGRLLEEVGLQDPVELARRLLEALTPKVPSPARLARVVLTDGHGRTISVGNPE